MSLRSNCLRVALALGAFVSAASLHAQVTATAATAPMGADDVGVFEVSGGAAYSHFNPGYAHQVRATNLEGWTASADYWFNRHVGGEATVRGLYGNYELPTAAQAYGLSGNADMNEYVFLVGPTFTLMRREHWRGGLHTLIGGAHGSFDKAFAGSGIQPFTVGVFNNQLAFTAAVGGWADYKVPQFSKLAVRFNADYQPTYYSSRGQNEFAGSVGLVYRFGKK